MPSRTDSVRPSKTVARHTLDTFKIWNRKGHYYLGLYFLFFLWLFAFTGLLLNHSSWKFAEFWPSRKVSRVERQISISRTGIDLDRAREAMRQLGITGEIEWTTVRPDSAVFEFRVNRPGHSFTVTTIPEQARASVEHTEINGWGVMRTLHTFTGVRASDPRNVWDWTLTKIWAFSMDAVSAGLILMVLTGLYMWIGLPAKRKLGVLALLLGMGVCGIFVIGLRWIYA